MIMKCKNVLIIDDDPNILQVMRDVLEMQGLKIYTATEGAEGAAKLKSILPEPCLILLDMMMPKMNGWQFLDIQRNTPEFKDVPVVICSAYWESAKAVHPQGLLTKPLQLSSLLQTVKEFCV
jgi:CheY-like chemotaxis protein